MQQKIVPNLWFDGNAEQAIAYYMTVFPDSSVVATQHYPNSIEEGLAEFQKDLAGKVVAVEFTLQDVRFTAINGGPDFKFTEAISFAINCKDQEEIDYYWAKLSAVPEAEQCGWCKDKFGISWQIVPENMNDRLKRPGAYANMMQMKKLVIADL